MEKVLKNFMYQALYQVLKIIMPIITIPIVSNALGPNGVGLYNYTNSIAQYFVLFATLGISLYGNREISIAWTKKERTTETFWEIFNMKGIVTIVVLLVYLILLLFLDNQVYLLVQSLVILAVAFDVSWFFMGIEDFKKTSLSNLVVQGIAFFCVVFLINGPEDTLLYTFIQGMSLLISNVVVFPFLAKYIKFKRVKMNDVLKHVRGTFSFFIPQAAIMLYSNLNKTLLGVFVGTAAVGYYTNSIQLNNVLITLITTIDMVLLPRMSTYFAKKQEDKIIDLMQMSLSIQLYISIPIMFGLLIIYDKLVPWFFGEEFSFIMNVIPVVSVLVVIVPLGLSISRQYLMPVGKIREYNRSVMIGAVINIIMNIILLPTIGFFGVIISNITAEFFVTFVRTRSFLKNTNFQFQIKPIILNILIAVVMLIITRGLTYSMAPTIFTNLIQVVIAAPIYFVLTTLCKANPVYRYLKQRIKI